METAITFHEPPITLKEKTLDISLDKLNAELADYKIRIDSLTDIYIDKDASALNQGDVLIIHCVYTNANEPIDNDLFFKGYLEMEDKFEALDGVYSAEFDIGELILTIVLNSHGIVINQTLATGGVVDTTVEQLVDRQLSENAKDVFDLVGISVPTSDSDAIEKTAQVRLKAIEHYRKLKPQPLYVFYGGEKMDIAPGAGMNVLGLQAELTKRLYNECGKRLQLPDHTMQQLYANNKAVLAIDMLKGRAERSTSPVFHITEPLIEEVVQLAQEQA